MPAWLNPAGGLRYHARARLAGREWRPFCSALAAWLPSFRARDAHALLVGPSAGYTFSDAFLAQFTELTILEPDPLAGYLLRRRLRRLGVVKLRLERADHLILPLLQGGAGLAELLDADPGACLIFGNVLGQTRFLIEDPDFERFKRAFRERIVPRLAGRAWLGFHDRLSGNVAPHFAQPYTVPSRLGDSAVLRDLYAMDRTGTTGELFDHQSDGFFSSDQPHTYFDWQIGGPRHHLIEAVQSAPETWPGAIR